MRSSAISSDPGYNFLPVHLLRIINILILTKTAFKSGVPIMELRCLRHTHTATLSPETNNIPLNYESGVKKPPPSFNKLRLINCILSLPQSILA